MLRATSNTNDINASNNNNNNNDNSSNNQENHGIRFEHYVYMHAGLLRDLPGLQPLQPCGRRARLLGGRPSWSFIFLHGPVLFIVISSLALLLLLLS